MTQINQLSLERTQLKEIIGEKWIEADIQATKEFLD